MAIAFDAFGNSNQGAGATSSSVSYSHTCTGSNRALVVFVVLNNASDNVTGATYGGVALTNVVSGHRIGGARWNNLYVLLGPSSGSNTLAITASSSTIESVISSSYTGVLQTSNDVTGGPGTTSGGNTVSLALTTTVDNDWTVYGYVENSFPATLTNVTLRSSAGSSDLGYYVGDSNGVIHPAGSYTASATKTGLTDGGFWGVALKPFTNQALTLTAAVGSFALTGFATTLSKGKNLIAAVGSFALTGFNAVLTYTPFPWQAQSKHTSSFTAESKHTSSFSAEGKNTSTWNAEGKH